MVTDMAYRAQSLEALDDDHELQARLVRKALKARFQGKVTYWQGDYIHGVAAAENLGHGDVALRLNRGLAPGDAIQLELNCLIYRGLPIAMEGEVVESTPPGDGKGFTALVHIHRNGRGGLIHTDPV